MRALLRAGLKSYARSFPLQGGKGRVVDTVAPLVGRGSEAEAAIPGGARMILDLGEHVQQRIYYFGAYEERTLAWARAYLRLGMTFVDAGAHVGQYTLAAALAVGPTGRVHAFEPGRANHRRLASNIKLNGFGNVTANQLALDEAPGEVELYEPDAGNSGENTLYRFSTTLSGSKVAAVSLDSYLAEAELGETGAVSLIKIDVQGAEERVVRGARETLARDRPAVICEFEERWLRGLGSSAERLLSLFGELGYRPFRLRRRGLKPLRKREGLEFETLVLFHESAAPSEP